MATREVNTAQFDSEIATGKVIVDFSATWCGPCKMLAPIVEAVSEKHNDIKFLKVDIDNDMELALRYKVMSVPTLIIFQDGEPVNKSIGLISEDELEDLLK